MKKLPLLFAIVTFLFLSYPLFSNGVEKAVFISDDPDVVYVTNALLYTKSAIITYADHPGTPTIMSLYALYVPARLVTKYLLSQNFVEWAFINFSLLVFYIRLFQVFLYSLSVFLFLRLSQNIAEKKYLVAIAWLLLVIFAGSNYAVYIAPETLSFLLTTFWLTVFLKFMVTPSYKLSVALSLLAGLTIANKFTATFLLIASLSMAFYIKEMSLPKRIAVAISNLGVAGISFMLGILPAIRHFDYIVQWVRNLFYHAGKHGTGRASVFDWETYSRAASVTIFGNWMLAFFLFFSLFLALDLVRKKKINIRNPVVALYAIAMMGIVVFAKYPAAHYNYVNIIVIIFCFIYFLSKAKVTILNIVLPLLILGFIPSFKGYNQSVLRSISSREPKGVYTILNIWTTPYWSGNLYRSELEKMGFKP